MLFISIVGFILGCFDYVLVIKGAELPLVDGVMAIVLGVVGLAFFVGGHFMLKRAEKKDTTTTAPQLDINNLEFIPKAIAKTRKRNMIVGIFLALFGVLIALVPFADDELGMGGIIGLGIFGALCFALGAFMLYKASKLINVEETDIYKTIMFEPKTITALHGQIFRSNVTKYGQAINATIFVGTKKLAILTVTETDLELFRQYLLKHNPGLDYKVDEQRT